MHLASRNIKIYKRYKILEVTMDYVTFRLKGRTFKVFNDIIIDVNSNEEFYPYKDVLSGFKTIHGPSNVIANYVRIDIADDVCTSNDPQLIFTLCLTDTFNWYNPHIDIDFKENNIYYKGRKLFLLNYEEAVEATNEALSRVFV